MADFADTTAPADTHTPFRQPPAELARKRAFSAWTTALKNHLYSTRRLTPSFRIDDDSGKSSTNSPRSICARVEMVWMICSSTV